MTNLEALQAQAKLICNTCYVDDDVCELMLMNEGLEADGEAVANDAALVRLAILIVKGWVETSRTEHSISASTDLDAVRRNILFWCNQSGLDASEYVDGIVTIDNGSDLW